MYKNRLKQVRLDNKLYQKDIANILGLSEIAYTNYENEYYVMPITHLISLCNELDISLDYIFEFSDKDKYLDINKGINNKKAGERLKEFRKENKLTQDKLAKLLNTNRSVIANYERGRNIIATPFLYTICSKYNISADYLVGRLNIPKYIKS